MQDFSPKLEMSEYFPTHALWPAFHLHQNLAQKKGTTNEENNLSCISRTYVRNEELI